MQFVLFFWFMSANTINPVLASQDFNSRASCVKAAQVLEHEFGADFRFACVEKGKVK